MMLRTIDFWRVPKDAFVAVKAGGCVINDQKKYQERYLLRLLEHGPFEKRPRGGWRFGTKVISDSAVESLLASGRAEIVGPKLKLKAAAKITARTRRSRNERLAKQFPSLE